MAIILNSDKISIVQDEYKVCSFPYVFFRIIRDNNGYRLMTATAAENRGGYEPYGDQQALISMSAQVLLERDMEIVTKSDHLGRPYIETSVEFDKADLEHLANIILNRMGFEDIEVLSLRDMLSIYDEYSDGDDGEDTYLSDGMWITSDGRLIEK